MELPMTQQVLDIKLGQIDADGIEVSRNKGEDKPAGQPIDLASNMEDGMITYPGVKVRYHFANGKIAFTILAREDRISASSVQEKLLHLFSMKGV